MKKTIILLLAAVPFLAQAQLETYGRYTAGGYVEPNINIFAIRKITKKVSLAFFGLVEQKWGQALIGANYAVSGDIILGAYTGIEHGSNSPRWAASFWRGKGKTSLLVWGEVGSGKDNYLYKINLFHKYSNRFTTGLTAWRGHGIGPNFRFNLPLLATTVWSMPAYDFETNKSRLMIGVSVNMGG
ncbi:hypothetical protein [Puia sp.]|uniref:hypothetical protein n=1 Tax=Puia sp. TaxID=2045100 RepID=UPI002F42F5D3